MCDSQFGQIIFIFLSVFYSLNQKWSYIYNTGINCLWCKCFFRSSVEAQSFNYFHYYPRDVCVCVCVYMWGERARETLISLGLLDIIQYNKAVY